MAEALAHPEQVAGIVVLDNNFPVDYLKVCTASGCIAEQVRPLLDIPIAEVSAMMNLDDCHPTANEAGPEILDIINEVRRAR